MERTQVSQTKNLGIVLQLASVLSHWPKMLKTLTLQPSETSELSWSIQTSLQQPVQKDLALSEFLRCSRAELQGYDSPSDSDIWMSTTCSRCLHSHSEWRPRSEFIYTLNKCYLLLPEMPKDIWGISVGLADTGVVVLQDCSVNSLGCVGFPQAAPRWTPPLKAFKWLSFPACSARARWGKHSQCTYSKPDPDRCQSCPLI